MIMNKRNIFIFFIAVAVLASLVFFKHGPKIRYRETKDLDAGLVSVDVCLDRDSATRKAARALDDAWQKMRDVYRRMNNDVQGSDIWKINHSFKNPQSVADDTIEIFRKLLHYQAIRPSDVNILSGQRIELLNATTKIKFGIITNGYAIDELAKVLRKRGFKNFLVDVNGSTFASGLNCSGERWKVAVHHPSDKTKILDVVQVFNAAIVVVGPPGKEVQSAAVIAPVAVDGAILASILSVLDIQHGEALIDPLGRDWASVVIRQEQGKFKIFKSKNYANFQIMPHRR